MGSHSVICHPTEVRIPPLHPAEAGTIIITHLLYIIYLLSSSLTFNTNNMQIIEFCCEQFNFILSSRQIANRRDKFIKSEGNAQTC